VLHLGVGRTVTRDPKDTCLGETSAAQGTTNIVRRTTSLLGVAGLSLMTLFVVACGGTDTGADEPSTSSDGEDAESATESAALTSSECTVSANAPYLSSLDLRGSGTIGCSHIHPMKIEVCLAKLVGSSWVRMACTTENWTGTSWAVAYVNHDGKCNWGPGYYRTSTYAHVWTSGVQIVDTAKRSISRPCG